MKTKKTKKQTKTGISKEIKESKPREGLRLSSPVMPSIIEFFAQVHLTDPEINALHAFLRPCVDVHFPDGEDGKCAILFFENAATHCSNHRDVLNCLADHGLDIRVEQYDDKPNKTKS